VRFQTTDPAEIPDPQAEETFTRSRLNWHERDHEPHASVLRLYGLLLGLRKTDPVIRDAPEENMVTRTFGSVLYVERWLQDDRRWILVNFGSETVDWPAQVDHVRLLASSSDKPFPPRKLPPGGAVIVATGQ
jgi:1,4-alpha-glucan branching enzyme